MRKNAGFTTVELIIVIAVIAILAAILIPVFTNIIDNANRSEAIQNAKNAYTQYAIDHVQEDGKLVDLIYVQQDDRVVIIDQGHTKDMLYSSREEALKALCDDPATTQDESLNFELVATENEKLFTIAAK